MLKRKVFLLLIMILSTSAYSQSDIDREEFMKSIYKTVVDSTFTNYYLAETCYPIRIRNIDSVYLVKEFAKHVDSIILKELITKASNDTLEYKWDCSKLPLTRCIKSDTVGYITWSKSVVTVQAKKGWSKRRLEKETLKKMAEEWEARNKKPRQEKIAYFFSRPIFSANGQFAIVDLSVTCGSLCGHGCIYLFQRKNGIWTKISTASCWIS